MADEGRYTNQMAFWLDARTIANSGDLDALFVHIRNAPPDFTLAGGHDAVFCAFYKAAQAGRVDILEDMRRRGFILGEERGSDALKHLAVYHSGTAAPAIRLLVQEWGANAESALNALATAGKVEPMTVMADCGMDVLNGNAAFFLAFFGGHPEMMEYLHDQGADLYHPSVLQGLYARKAEPGAAALTALASLMEKERVAAAELLAPLLPRLRSLADARTSCTGPRGEETTVLHLCALAGAFSRVLDLPPEAPGLAVQDLLAKDGGGRSVLALLAARGEAQQAFDPRLWKNAPETALLLHRALADLRAGEAVDVKEALASIRRQKALPRDPKRFTL